ncbi:MAG: BlaI/MecI/CopY family transcriptional regulator [Phycisphaerae bacterium]|nr:BlaI/MecI/CopY family transcriptional regulator [Phycisphaerae bacterium]
MQFLCVLWGRGPCTAREMLGLLPDGKERAYTTVLSVLQVMEKKGLLGHSRKGNANVYYPNVARGDVLGSFMKRMVTNLFGGSPTAAMQLLLEEGEMSPEDFQRMRQVLDDQPEGDK